MQFGFQGVEFAEASFTTLETISHMLERCSKIFGCFLDVHKGFDTVWIDGLLFKLFTELICLSELIGSIIQLLMFCTLLRATYVIPRTDSDGPSSIYAFSNVRTCYLWIVMANIA